MHQRASLFLLAVVLTAGSLQAGDGRLNADGTLDLQVNFRYPPTTAQIDAMRAQLELANDIICDTTDGQVRFGQVRLTGGGAAEDADFGGGSDLGLLDTSDLVDSALDFLSLLSGLGRFN